MSRRIVAPPPQDQLEGPAPPAGNAWLVLSLGPLSLRLHGLPEQARERLGQRWAVFEAPHAAPGLDVEVVSVEQQYYIDPARDPELNAANVACDGRRVRFVSYAAAGWFDTRGGKGRILLARGTWEPADSAIENYVRAAVAWQAAERGGALVHAASAVFGGLGYLFYGESGAGKSTLAACNRRAVVVSDDLSLLLPDENGRLELVGSPFRGTHETGERVVGRFPLAAGFRLKQAAEAAVRGVPRIQGLAELCANLPFVAEAFAVRPDLFQAIERSFAAIPLKHLHFRKDDSYWDAIRDAGL